MPLSAAVRGDLFEGISELIELLFPGAGAAVSFGLNRDVVASATWTVRSGTSFLFVAANAALLVCSSSGALSEDLPTAFDAGLPAVVEGGALFFPALVEDRRLWKKMSKINRTKVAVINPYFLIKTKTTIPTMIASSKTITPATTPMRISAEREREKPVDQKHWTRISLTFSKRSFQLSTIEMLHPAAIRMERMHRDGDNECR